VAGFLEYATEAFQQDKNLVLGLLSPFFPTLQEARDLASGAGVGADPKAAADVLNGHSRMRRPGVALMIRLVGRNGVQGAQVAFFIPWDRPD
jgi:hypothetical protein